MSDQEARGLTSAAAAERLVQDGPKVLPVAARTPLRREAVAMGRSGTDAARRAADLVLLDDDLTTIVAAIAHGRAGFGDIRRFLTYHLTDNVAELAPFVVRALSGGRFPPALGVLQVLAPDIGTDTLPAVAPGAEPPAPRTLEGPPMRGRLLDRIVATRALGIAGPIEATLGMVAFVTSLVVAGRRPGSPFPTSDALLAASGATFATVVLGQMAKAFACRSSTLPAWRVTWGSNRFLAVAVAIELTAIVAALSWTPLASLLGQAPPPTAGWVVALSAVPAVLVADAFFKHVRRPRDPDGAEGSIER